MTDTDNSRNNITEDTASQPMQTDIDPRLLELLVCPQTRGTLVYDKSNQELLSKNAGLAYPIRDSIPIMLPDEARALSDAEINRL